MLKTLCYKSKIFRYETLEYRYIYVKSNILHKYRMFHLDRNTIFG